LLPQGFEPRYADPESDQPCRKQRKYRLTPGKMCPDAAKHAQTCRRRTAHVGTEMSLTSKTGTINDSLLCESRAEPTASKRPTAWGAQHSFVFNERSRFFKFFCCLAAPQGFEPLYADPESGHPRFAVVLRCSRKSTERYAISFPVSVLAEFCVFVTAQGERIGT
jgi:hypothetical protein